MKIYREELQQQKEETPIELFYAGCKSPATKTKYTRTLNKILCDVLEDVLEGTSSQSVTSESECIDNCIFSGKFNTREEKFCEFDGIFGKTHWEKTPDEITLEGKSIFKETKQ